MFELRLNRRIKREVTKLLNVDVSREIFAACFLSRQSNICSAIRLHKNIKYLKGEEIREIFLNYPFESRIFSGTATFLEFFLIFFHRFLCNISSDYLVFLLISFTRFKLRTF